MRLNMTPVSEELKKEIAEMLTNAEDKSAAIAEAMEKVGTEGVITIEESKTAETYSEVVEGMMFDRGYITPYMATDMEKMEAVKNYVEHIKAHAVGEDQKHREHNGKRTAMQPLFDIVGRTAVKRVFAFLLV